MLALSKFNTSLGYAEIVERYEYSVFGQTSVTIDGGTGNPYRFTGRRFDPEAVTATFPGLYYYRARMYSPALGRFLQTDPIGYADSMNLYAYCGNNPINWFDPFGLLSYLVSRPLGGDSKYFTHNFIVTNADYIGDPDATVYSYGMNAEGNVGKVDENTKGFSEGTHKTDIDFWNSLTSSAEDQENIVHIPTSDLVAELYAEALIEDQDYSAISGPFGANSNSAAQAVANAASNRELPTPGKGRISPGAGSWDEIKFDIEKVLQQKREEREKCKK